MTRILLSVLTVLLLPVFAIFADGAKKEIASLNDAKTVEEINSYVLQLLKNQPAEKPQKTEDFAKLFRDRGKISFDGGEKILSIAKNDSEKIEGYKLKITGLQTLLVADKIEKKTTEESAEIQTKLDKLIEELAKRFPSYADNNDLFAKFLKEVNDVRRNFSIEKFDELVKKAKKLSVTRPGNFTAVTPLNQIIIVAGSNAAIESDPQLLEKTIKDISAFVNSKEFALPETDKKAVLDLLEGYSLRSVGANPEIYGRTLDDKNFDWTSLRGKYVLVKFTASWCGPCKGEIPGMISAYEKYHDKGLEIVSIYVWDKLDATKKIVETEKIPWIIISEELTEKAGQSLQGKKYAIAGVPTMFLVDKDGKIIATETRGENLQKKLAEIFGEDDSKKSQKETVAAFKKSNNVE